LRGGRDGMLRDMSNPEGPDMNTIDAMNDALQAALERGDLNEIDRMGDQWLSTVPPRLVQQMDAIIAVASTFDETIPSSIQYVSESMRSR